MYSTASSMSINKVVSFSISSYSSPTGWCEGPRQKSLCSVDCVTAEWHLHSKHEATLSQHQAGSGVQYWKYHSLGKAQSPISLPSMFNYLPFPYLGIPCCYTFLRQGKNPVCQWHISVKCGADCRVKICGSQHMQSIKPSS